MNKSKLRSLLNSCKVQDSSNPIKLATSLRSIGLEVPILESGFAFVSDNIVIQIPNADLYGRVAAWEYDASDLYATIDKVNSLVEYKVGDILVADVAGDALCFIAAEVSESDYIKGYGEVSAGVFGYGKYTHSKCRKANKAEKAAFIKLIAKEGIDLDIVDGVVDVFKLRVNPQSYYAVTYDFKRGAVSVAKFNDTNNIYDQLFARTGNYFKTAEEAREALKSKLKNEGV